MLLCLGTTPTVQRTMVFERVTVDGVNRAVEVHEHASGKSVNVARVASQLGEKVLAFGFAGGDRGAFLLRELDRSGIDHRFVTVAAQTRLCTTVLDRSAGTATELVEESAAVAAGDWERLSEVFAAALAEATLCVFSGSLPPGGPPDFYARCARAAGEAGCRLILDARGEPLRLALGQHELIVKLNREELAATVGQAIHNDRALREAMLQAAPLGGCVVVTMGREGAVAFDGAGFWKVSTPAVQTVSAIGSGDAFAAGLAVGLARGQSFHEACALGSACGAANAVTPLSGSIDPARVPELLESVQLVAW